MKTATAKTATATATAKPAKRDRSNRPVAFGLSSADYQRARYYFKPGEREMRQRSNLKRYYQRKVNAPHGAQK